VTAIQPQRDALYRIDRRAVPKKQIDLMIDGEKVSVPEGSTILAACATIGVEIPTLCYLETLHPVNVCRVCVVEVEGARVLAPACSRQVEPGMVVKTRSERVDLSRKLVLEMLASSVDLSTTPSIEEWMLHRTWTTPACLNVCSYDAPCL
jgi:predicted molibdopterin-dependent oxidoreductase YjgC